MNSGLIIRYNVIPLVNHLSPPKNMATDSIVIRGAREHNLKNIDLDIPRDRFVVITGISGSGKTSLAFDTIYAEGQRRFMESLSAYARQFLGMMERPDTDFIDGLSPVISIDQKTTSRNPRSTVGTVTEIYDYLRLLFARAGTPYSYITGNPMKKQTPEEVVSSILQLSHGTRAYCLAPVVRGRKGHYRELFDQTMKQGFIRVRIDGEFRELEKDMQTDRYKTHDIEVVVDRFVVSENSRNRIEQSIQVALDMADGNLILAVEDGDKPSGFRDKDGSQAAVPVRRQREVPRLLLQHGSEHHGSIYILFHPAYFGMHLFVIKKLKGKHGTFL